ncbi:UvrD-helicase domain-containing protein [Streptomyces marispadix]|uniref:DNA 3'-5' helicase n=1 Tax=Streptomyces marispadix TaxID=2922868 RepID=A0ABS9SYX1_9ACTN|nr:UvrD-helicase domain-containing protein [Streptomyces marispadix]MCH6161479.1 UvrD-helicase domain-containing protein [Streptomyces marispadix]
MLDPTDEQAAAVDAFRDGQHLALQAGAGTGKTTTLVMLANSVTSRGRYIAFNKAIATAAARTFPRHVLCKTAHSLAFAAVGHKYLSRMNAPRTASWRIGQSLGISKGTRIGARDVSTRALSHSMLQTVTGFCHSSDPELTARHVPSLRGIEAPEERAELAELVLPYARKAWEDLQQTDEGIVRFEHDHYLKIWALAEPRIPVDFLLLDEAQDTNPVLEKVLHDQRDHAQLVMVGDSAQAIYGWRGARDVMTGFDGTHLHLSRSFRFGPRLAEEANRWLTIAEAPIRLTGTPDIKTTVSASSSSPAAVLCRTNVGAMIEVLHHLDAGKRVALVGGGGALQALAVAARDLKSGRRTTHPELILFRSWGELQDYAANDPSGRDLAPLVDLVDEHGAEAILTAVDELTHEDRAEITISTAHKAKGREWPSIRIAEDFTPPPDDEDSQDEHGKPLPGPIDLGEARLSYVAVTRARQHLDLGGLSWIHRHPQGSPL